MKDNDTSSKTEEAQEQQKRNSEKIKVVFDSDESSHQQEQLFVYLSNFKDKSEIASDSKALGAFKLIFGFASLNSNKDRLLTLCFKYNLMPILVKVLSDKYKILETSLRENSERVSEKSLLSFSSKAVNFLRNMTSKSVQFCTELVELDGVGLMLGFLKLEPVIVNYIRLSSSPERNDSVSEITSSLIRGSIDCLVNCAKVYAHTKAMWKKGEDEADIINYLPNYLLDLGERLRGVKDCQLAVFVLVASIFDEAELEKLTCLGQVIKTLSQVIGKFGAQLEESSSSSSSSPPDKRVKRVVLQSTESDVEENEVCALSVRQTVWNLIEILNALYHIALNDQVKYRIYEECQMNESLRRIIYYGNEVEVEFALRMLWQLCFDHSVAVNVIIDERLMARIDELKKGGAKKPSLKVACDGILWFLGQHVAGESETDELEKEDLRGLDAAAERKKGNATARKTEAKHIMISYERRSRELCLKMKLELENVGYKIWIDAVENSTNVANAIENSSCLLICMTENYKQSPQSRAEAEFAFQLNKPMIPVIMQKNYTPDGWLNIIMGFNVWVNFSNCNFAEFMDRVKGELSIVHLTGASNSQANLEIPIISFHGRNADRKQPKTDLKEAPKNLQVISQSPLEWNESQVENWLNERAVNTTIQTNVMPCDGKILNQIYSMLSDAPEFFYCSISSRPDSIQIPTLRDLAQFAYELKSLFGN